MTTDEFFAKFDLLANCPNAVQKMRELILELAFDGKVIPMKSEWPRVALKSVSTKIGSGSTPSGGRESYFKTGIPLIRSMNVHFRGFEHFGLVFLSEEQAAQLANVAVQENDVLLNITGASIGRCTTAPADMVDARVNQHVTIIRTKPELAPEFLAKFLASPRIQWMINDIQVGATRQALTKGMIEQFVIPLPPLAEQKRIVAKVDELMALCDALEVLQKEREAKRSTLAKASLAAFAEAPSPTSLELLFHPSYAIDPADLRKSILTLAVQGKLVEQDGGDEVEMISMERLVGRANLKNGYSARPISDKSSVTCLPLSAMRGGEIDCSVGKPVAMSLEEAIPYLIMKDDVFVIRGNGSKDLVGRAGIVRGEPINVIYPDLFIKIPLPVERITGEYFLLAWNCPEMRAKIEVVARTTSGILKINQRHISEFDLPLPPLAEQKRIVAKVDELMALVDRLEAKLVASREVAARLLEAMLAELAGKGAD